MSAEIPTKSIDLFGGAITALVPGNFVDASQFREVPDNQEAYVSMTDDTDISILVDILQHVVVGDGSDEVALAVHWDDVAVDEERTAKIYNKERVVLKGLPDKTAYNILGTISARPQDPVTNPPLFTALMTTVLRLPEQGTDIVITINVPYLTTEMVRLEGTLACPSYSGEMNGVRGDLLQAGMQVREKFLDSFKIQDWTLFASEP